MKYIVNEQNSCGQATLPDEKRNSLLEALGYSTPQPEQINESVAPEAEQSEEESATAPALYEWDGSVFALDDEVFEIEGELFLKADELDSETQMSLDESHEELFINKVAFDETEFDLGDIYDYGEEIYIRMDEFKKGTKSKDKPEDKGDFETGERKGDKSNQKKDDDDKGDFETGMRKGDKSNQKSKKGDKPDFTTDMRKGDKSKTHPGRKDFEGLKKKVVKEEETPEDRVKRQVGNLDLSDPKARERANHLKRRLKAQQLDKTKPRTKPPVASAKDADAAAKSHGDM